jgi:hypothetical protein
MIFREDLAEKVMRSEKTVTRRLCSDNPRSPWWVEKCSLIVGRDYSVCPGRGKTAIGRVVVTHVHRMRLGWISHAESLKEGFGSRSEFYTAWNAINGAFDVRALVWRVEFEVIPDIDHKGAG